MTRMTSLLAAVALALGSTTALAQSPAGNPADPNTNQNQQPAPSGSNPADPATGADPSARVPTSPPGTGETTGPGPTTGSYESPAGSPADPNTPENQQPGPSVANPADPAAGSNPGDRVPTDRSTE